MSPKSAGLAKKAGYANVKVYLEGEPGWKKAGHYTASDADYVKAANIVLVDLRSPDMVRAGHIPKAVSIPAKDLAGAEEKFPAFKGAHIVFYSDSEEDVKSAVKTAREWGYKNTTALLGGISGWKAKGYEIKTGAAADKITYSRKLEPDEIGITEFEKAMKSGDAVIVDVRAPDEFKQGHFKGAVNIPADAIARLYMEIPKDKIVLTHCTTGLRAEMAYSVLLAKGYRVKFLKANVEFEPDGRYVISE
jgi:rhodanese-related sulfurtransferase